MPLKMIITDLDGTFYNEKQQFNQQKFNELYARMKQRDIQFVVASGNQYYQLISFFEQHDDMAFVSENGGCLIDKNEEIFAVEIQDKTWRTITHALNQMKNIFFLLVCGKKSAYVLDSTPKDIYDFYKQFFPKLSKVQSFQDVNDQIFKIAIACTPEYTDEVANEMKKYVNEELSVVTSGHGYIDVIVKGIHKAHAIQILMDRYSIHPDEVMAFGDAMNDSELLQLVKYGFVMKNGNEELKQTIGRVCPYTNNENGVLKMIEEYLDAPEVFLQKYQ